MHKNIPINGPSAYLVHLPPVCLRDGWDRESDQHQYRFQDIIDPDSGKVLYTIEHEVRSMKHPLYLRPLVNRNPSQSIIGYSPGDDARNWAMSSN
jgi:hypothetical protein